MKVGQAGSFSLRLTESVLTEEELIVESTFSFDSSYNDNQRNADNVSF